MKFSLMVPEDNLRTNHGYGVATDGVYRALTALGHEVSFNDPAAPVEIGFTQPWNWNWSNPDSYKIGYVPWESTRLPEGWLAPMQAADEIWTTSEWCRDVFEKNGLNDVKVYHHGVETFGDHGWPRKRRRAENRPIRFLHVGEPAPRKGGQIAYDAFTQAFLGSADATLTIKAFDYYNIRGIGSFWTARDGGLYVNDPDGYDNVSVVTTAMEHFELLDLFHRHDVLVYPSYGEGFGLIPLQAMVSGMPVICTGAWAPYRKELLPELRLPAKLVPSPWPDVHPGNMYEPDVDSLAKMMKTVADPDVYRAVSARAYAASFEAETQFDWIKVTMDAFAHIFNKFDSA